MTKLEVFLSKDTELSLSTIFFYSEEPPALTGLTGFMFYFSNNSSKSNFLIFKSFNSFSELYNFFVDAVAQRIRQADADIQSFSDALWLEDGLSKNTLQAYRRDLVQLARWLAPSTRGVALAEASEADLLAYLDRRAHV